MQRIIGWGVAVAALAGVACDAIGTERPPLTVVEQRAPAGAPASTAGAAGAPGRTRVPGTPAPAQSPGPTMPGEAACWTGSLPAEPRAPEPILTIDAACALGASASSRTFPETNQPRNNNHAGDIVGRWVACGQNNLWQGHVGAIEFGGNARWQALTTDAAGALVPSTPAARGYFSLLNTGQLNFKGEGFGSGVGIYFVKFADGNRDVLLLTDVGGPDPSPIILARVAASPTNGDDNAPSVSDGRCSMVGDWDVPANDAVPSAPASTWSFDGRGNFVVGPRGAVACDAHTMYGTYRLTEGMFELTTNYNLGLCDWWFNAGWPATFDAGCAQLTLRRQWDNCTGGRGYLNEDGVTLRRRQ